jgi:alcohol dehydrogenase class IV
MKSPNKGMIASQTIGDAETDIVAKLVADLASGVAGKVGDAAAGLRALNDTLGLTMSLGALGLKQTDIERAASAVGAATFPNPRAATPGAVRQLLLDAL